MSEPREVDPLHGDPDDGADPRPVRRGPMLLRLLAILPGVLVGIFLVDRVVAWWDSAQGADGGQSAIVHDERLVWTNRPHFENPEFGTRLDRFGNRNEEIPDDAPPTEVRIAGFGASNLYGAGGALQSWLWNVKLQTVYDRRAPPPVRVINGGVMAYSTLQAARRASMLLDALEPDLVFLVVQPGAQAMLDPSAERAQVRYGPGQGDLIPADIAAKWPAPSLPVIAAVHRVMSAQSAIYRRHRAKFRAEGADRDTAIQRWTLSEAPLAPTAARMLPATFREIESLAAECRRRGIEFRALVLPENDMGTDAMWADYVANNQRSGAPPIGTHRREPTQVLERMLRERGISTWNFEPEADVIGKERARHTTKDRDHWSEAGHEVIARGILRRLDDEGLVARLAERRAAAPRKRPYGASPFAADDA